MENESDVVLGIIQKIISENAQTAMDQEEYNRRDDAYSERFEAARKGCQRSQSFGRNEMPKRQESSCSWKT